MGIQEFLLDRAEKKGIEIGVEKGLTRKDEILVKNLLTSTDFSIAKIAGLVGMTEDFVLKIKKELGL